MNFRKLLLGLGLVTAGAAVPAMAAESVAGDSVSLDLDKVLEIALSDNPDIQVADRTIEIQKYAKKETLGGLFPTVSATAAGVKNIIVQTMTLKMGDQVIKAKMGQPYNYTLTGTVALPLVAPQLWKSIELSQEQVELAVEQARESKVNTIASVKNAFYQLLLARDSYDVLQASFATSAQNLDETRQKFAQGSVAEYDTLTAYVQHESMRPNILSAANGVKLAEMQLKVLMGVDVNEPLRFTGHLSDYEEKLFSDLMILKSDTTLADNSTLKQLDSQRRQLVLAEKINKLGYIPTLALQFEAGYMAMPQEFNPFKASYSGHEALTLALSWTIWDGNQRYNKSRQNQLTLQNLDEQRANVERQLELAINSSLNSIETAAEQVVTNKSNVYAAEKAYTISCKRYEIGSGTQLEKNSSETNFLSTRLQYVQSIYDFLTNQVALEKTLGKMVTDK